MKDNPRGYELPEEISPPTISFCIEVPDEEFHLRAFWGAMWSLTRPYNWGNDDDHTALEVADVWRELWFKNHTAWRDRECSPDQACQSFSPTSPQLTWGPENPYAPGESVPAGYLFHPWTIVDSSILGTIIGDWGLGYEVGDVYTDLTKLPIGDWGEIIEDGYLFFPHFRVNALNGSGTVRFHLLNIPQGGRALIVVDGVLDLLNLRLVELNKDILSIPFETQVPIIIEVEIPLEGEHYIDVVFVPNVNDESIPFFFGGGIRAIEICGFGRTGCDCMDEECCDKITTRLDEQIKRFDKIIRFMEGGITMTFNEPSLPNDFAVDCSPSEFDKDAGETDEEILADRKTALCLTVARYILATLWRYGKSMNMGATTKADLLLLMDLDAPPDFYPQLLPGNNDHVTLQMVSRIAGTGTTAFENVICAMILGLTGDHNTFAEFKASLILGDVSIYPDVETHWLTEIIVACNQQRKNYTVFARELDTTYDEIVDGLEYECPCEVITPTACTEPLELEFKNGRGLTIDLVGTDLYHFTGDPGTESGGTYFGGCYVRDALGRCLEVYEPTTGETGLPVGWTGQAVSYHFVIGCCGTSNHEGPGGFAGGAGGGTYYTEFYWDCGNTTGVDTYYKVRCKDTSECE